MKQAFVNKFIKQAIYMQDNIALLYDLFARVLSADSKFWEQMAREKRAYSRLLELSGTRVCNKLLYIINSPNIARIEEINKKIQNYRKKIAKDSISRNGAFKIAMQIEHLAYDEQFRDALADFNIDGIFDIFALTTQKAKDRKLQLMRYMKENRV